MAILAVIITLIIIPYFWIGLEYSRNKYALEVYKTNQLTQSQGFIASKVKSLERDLSYIEHKSYCHLEYPILAKDGCTCNSKREWWSTQVLIDNAKDGIIVLPEPASPWKNMLCWPVQKTNDYLRSGEVNKPDYAWIEAQEKKLEIS